MDYPSNSFKSKEEAKQLPAERNVQKVVTGVAKAKKKNELLSIGRDILTEDMESAKEYIRKSAISSTKSAISDICDTLLEIPKVIIDTLLYGESGGRRGSHRTNAGSVSYTKYYDDKDRKKVSSVSSQQVRTGRVFDDIELETRGEAEEVIEGMSNIIDSYGYASVLDLHDLAGYSTTSTSDNYGWASTKNFVIEQVRDRDMPNGRGYVIRCPKAMPLDKK